MGVAIMAETPNIPHQVQHSESARPLKVLVGCEYSGVVRDAFLALGHDAMSCDLLPTDSPGPHHQGDVRDLFNQHWDIGIFHPPCTYLTKAGVCHLYTDGERWKQLIDGAVFFRELLNAPIAKVAVENPVMHRYATSIIGRKQTQVVQPWMFGHPEKKGTGFWLRGLPPLLNTEDVRGVMATLPVKDQQRTHYLRPGPDRWKLRSMTFPGIAAAMAEQWGGHVSAEVAHA